jgi:MFS family permease
MLQAYTSTWGAGEHRFVRQGLDGQGGPGAAQPAPAAAPHAAEAPAQGIAAAFETPVFRRIWGASLCMNLGMMIQMVGSSWAMTQLAATPTLVALVQTAVWTPTMILAIPAGAIADMYDRRKVAIAASLVALGGALGLAASSGLGLLAPYLLLGFCFLIGSGGALMGPAWQASVVEQAPPRQLPSAIALTSISLYLARCIGPALGGAIVAVTGAFAAFVINAACYLPALGVLIAWRRAPAPPSDREGVGRSIAVGLRYIAQDRLTRAIVTRTFALSLPGGAATALYPLVARDLLHGNARTFGLLLGAYGLGSVFGACNLGWLRRRVRIEPLLALGAACAGAGVLVVALVHAPPVALAALFVAGAFWVISFTVFNIELQVAAPNAVVGRLLAVQAASASGGGAIGSALWGLGARAFGVQAALTSAGLAMMACALMGLWLPADPAIPGEGRARLRLEP